MPNAKYAHSNAEAVEEALQEYQHDMSDISRRTGMDMDASDPSYAHFLLLTLGHACRLFTGVRAHLVGWYPVTLHRESLVTTCCFSNDNMFAAKLV